MRVTPSQLRRIVISPRRFVAAARVAVASDQQQFGNPQRHWMEAAWRAYFANGRDPDILWQTFSARSLGSNDSPRRRSLARGAEPMLDRCLEWDGRDADSPADWFPRTRDIAWHGHVLALRRDLSYLTTDGYRLRQLWTDRELRVAHTEAGLMLAAVLACADVELGADRTEAIEVWQLRDGTSRTWSRDELLAEAARLKQRLDEVAAALAQP